MNRQPTRFLAFAAFLVLCSAAVVSEPGSSLSGQPTGSSKPIDSRYRGLVVPVKQVLLVAPLDAIISKIRVKEGEVVKAGDTLATMDEEIQKLVVEAAKLKADSTAAIEVAKLAVDDAKLEVEKAEDLFKKDAITKWEVQKRHVVHKTKIAEEVAAKEQGTLAGANLRLEEAKLRKHSILAPFDGTIIDVVTEEGATLARNDKVFVIAATTELDARINLPIAVVSAAGTTKTPDFNYMKSQLGKPFRFKAGDPVNREITATLKNVRDIIDPGSNTFLCEFTIENADRKMPAGFSVDLIWPQ